MEDGVGNSLRESIKLSEIDVLLRLRFAFVFNVDSIVVEELEIADEDFRILLT